MTAPVTVNFGFAINPADTTVSILRIETGKARVDVEIPSAEIVAALRGVADLAEREIAARAGIFRPPPGLFLPNGAQPLPGTPTGGDR